MRNPRLTLQQPSILLMLGNVESTTCDINLISPVLEMLRAKKVRFEPALTLHGSSTRMELQMIFIWRILDCRSKENGSSQCR